MRSTAARVLYGVRHGSHFITWQLQLSEKALAAGGLHATGAALCTAPPHDAFQRQHYSTSCSSAKAAGYVPHAQQWGVSWLQVSSRPCGSCVYADIASILCTQRHLAPLSVKQLRAGCAISAAAS